MFFKFSFVSKMCNNNVDLNPGVGIEIPLAKYQALFL